MGVASAVVGFVLNIGVVIFALIAFIVALIVMTIIKSRKYKLPPGPPAYPLIGNLLGPQLNIALNNTEVVLEALVKKAADFSGRSRTVSSDRISDGGRSIGFGEGRVWKLQRKISTQAIRHFMKGSCLEKNVYINMETLEDLIKNKQGPFDPTKDVLILITNIMCGVCFGFSHNIDDDEFRKIIALFEAFSDGSFGSNGFFFYEDFIPFLDRCPTKGFKALGKAMDWFFSMIQKQIDQHRKTLDPNNIQDLTDALLVAQSQEDVGDDKEALSEFSDRHMVQTLSDLFLAGIDTTKLTVIFALKHMALRQDVQNKVHEEIKRVVDLLVCDDTLTAMVISYQSKVYGSRKPEYPERTTKQRCALVSSLMSHLHAMHSTGRSQGHIVLVVGLSVEKAGVPKENHLATTSTWQFPDIITPVYFARHNPYRPTVPLRINIPFWTQHFFANRVGNLPKISDKENLSYTDAVIHEVLRIHPVSPIATPHKTMCDTSVGGFDIPKGTQVIVNLWALHRDPDKWENVEEFRPERFLGEDGKMATKPDSWLPFSTGRRVCPGESVAKPELVLLLACFMQRFKLRFPDGVTPNMSDEFSLFSLIPKRCEIIFEER